uniref:beta-2 adrenergic receptor-like n=1 Tax=Myxine glutinosa TaxID=7769 RepID=UPI00358F91B7
MEEPWFIILSIASSIIVMLTICGNTLVIACVIHSRNIMQSITSYFICSLACADLLIGIGVMPFTAFQIVKGNWIFGSLACNIRYMMDISSVTASINSLCLIAIDRYVAVMMPLRYRTLMTSRRAFFLIVIVWVEAISLSFIPLHFGWYRATDQEAQECYDNPECCVFIGNVNFVFATAIFPFYIPITAMIFLYARILKEANRQVEKINQTGVSSTRNENTQERNSGGRTISHNERRALKTLVVVLGVFIVCWLPFFIMYPVQGICRHCITEPQFHITIWVGYLNSVCNPILYTRNPEFLAAYKLLLCKNAASQKVKQWHTRRQMRKIVNTPQNN